MTLTELRDKAKELVIKNYGQKKEETLINEIELLEKKPLTIDEQLLELSQRKDEYFYDLLKILHNQFYLVLFLQHSTGLIQRA